MFWQPDEAVSGVVVMARPASSLSINIMPVSQLAGREGREGRG